LQQLTDQGRQKIDEIARRYSVSTDAAMTLLQALVNSNGTMARYNHWELGGGGQWMRGGMTMVDNARDRRKASSRTSSLAIRASIAEVWLLMEVARWRRLVPGTPGINPLPLAMLHPDLHERHSLRA
jgi:hypothetical protein